MKLELASTSIDKAAIGLSLICAVHCLVVPVAAVLLPTLAAMGIGDERFHLWLLLAVLPISVLALTLGCRQHRSFAVMAYGLLGLFILTLTVLFGHDVLGESGEKIASLSGALIIALAHIKNHKMCKTHSCACD